MVGLDAARIATRYGDLMSFGLVSASDKIIIDTMLADGTPDSLKKALSIIEEKEKKALSKKAKPSFGQKFKSLTASLPVGYGITEDGIITGVPNYVIYGAGLFVAFMGFKAARKRK